MENKLNDGSQKTSTHTYYRYLVPGASPNNWWYSVWFQRKHGSAPQAADAARYARTRKNATETCKWGRKKRPVIIWCEWRIDNKTKRCLC